MPDPAVDAALVRITRTLVEILTRDPAPLPATANPCCDHAGCHPASYDVGDHPHHCTVIPRERCKAYVSGQGCVWGIRRTERPS